jgi:hypothetical protein
MIGVEAALGTEKFKEGYRIAEHVVETDLRYGSY